MSEPFWPRYLNEMMDSRASESDRYALNSLRLNVRRLTQSGRFIGYQREIIVGYRAPVRTLVTGRQQIGKMRPIVQSVSVLPIVGVNVFLASDGRLLRCAEDGKRLREAKIESLQHCYDINAQLSQLG